MPKADGYEVCRQSKELHPDVPVLLLVGTFEPFDAEKAAAVHADGHLKKPFDSQDLLSQVQSLTGGPAAGAPAAAPVADVAAAEVAPPIDVAPPVEAPPPVAVPDLEPPVLLEEEPAMPAATAEVEVEPQAPEMVFEEPPMPMATMPVAAEPVEPFPATTAPEPEPPAAEEIAAAPELEPPMIEPRAAAVDEPEPAAAEEPEVQTPEPAAEAVAAPEEDDSAAAESAPDAAAAANGNGALSDGEVDRIARRVVEMLGEKMLREVAWEVVPDLAELIIKERIRELESQVE